MSLFKQLPPSEIIENFTHIGRFAGIVPVYVNIDHSPIMIQERNWVPAWCLSGMLLLYSAFMWTVLLIDDDFEPMWPIDVTGEIVKPS